MSTNGVNISEDADMAECEEEKVVTMMDVLQEQQEFEDDANAVLGASDDKNCTYSKGYIKRQAIYACLTCCEDAKFDPTKRAGVCLACSLTCHENHELIELYTKRNFRCDCGNPKFNNHPCQFVPEKSELNEDNKYNQNFGGLYCTCHRPYPDPEATFEDEMIQCIVCEDWLHAAHLEATLPTSDYAEMVCKACMEKNEFLHSYSDFAISVEEDVDILAVSNADTSIANNSSEFNGVIEKVNGGADIKETDVEMTSTDKIESVANESDALKAEEVSDTAVEKNIEAFVPESAEDIDKTEDSEATKEKPIDAPSDPVTTDNKSEKTEEIHDSVVDSSSKIDDLSESKKINESEVKENKEEMADPTSNDTSIIDTIEKMENELGNVEPKEDKLASTEGVLDVNSETTDNNAEGEENITADKAKEDSTVPDPHFESQEEKKQDEVVKDNVEMNGDNNPDNSVSENNMTVGNLNTLETIENGTTKASTSETNEPEAGTEDSTKDNKRKLSTEEAEDVTSKKPKLDDTNCAKPKGVKKRFKGATFWPSNFRQMLCTCNECITMYKDLSVLFLTDAEDTVTAYETLGRQKIDGTATSQYEKGMEALTSLDRIQQINALTEYNKMRDKLLDYLQSFKERKEVVKEEDIKAFFAGMKPKRESDGVYFCR